MKDDEIERKNIKETNDSNMQKERKNSFEI